MICATVRVKKMEEVIKKLKKLPENYDLTEIWIDEIEDLQLQDLMNAKTTKYLFKFTQDSFDIVKQCLNAGVEMIDIDINTPLDIIEAIKNAKKDDQKLILSYHDFEKTPFYSDAVDIVNDMKNKGADICKLVFTANENSDNLVTLKLLSQKEILGTSMISFCMGDVGKMSRIYSPHFGSEIDYIPPDETWQTAQGQIPLEKWKIIQETIK